MTNLSSDYTRGWIRFRIPVGILTAYAISQSVVWHWPTLSNFFRFQFFVASTVLAAVVGAIWCLFSSWLTGPTKFAGVVLCCASALLATKATRVDGYLGDATPNLAWSWAARSTGVLGGAQPAGDVTAESRDFLAVGWFDSPGFLGRQRSATVQGLRLATDWMRNPPKQLWRRDVGPGWSSFAVTGSVAITQEQRGDDEATVCYDLETGHERWVHLEGNVRFDENYGGAGPRATPTIHNRQVYSLGATGILNCLDGTTGSRIWSTNILQDAGADNLGWGMSGSPLVFDEMVVVNPGGTDGRSVIAYHAQTGQVAWQTGTGQAAYSSPIHVTVAGVEQVVLLNGPGLEGYEANTGQPLWSFPWVVNGSGMTSLTQPVPVGADRFFISSGYGQGCALLTVNITEDGFSADTVWPPNRNLKSKLSSLVLRDGFVYGLDEQVLVCLDLQNGKRRWKGGRYGHGQLLLVEDLLLVQAESGDVALVQATPDGRQELARFSPLSSKTWTVPVVAGNKLLVRSDREAACYELPVAE